MKSSLYSASINPRKTRKTVRISSETQEKEISPEAKELNRQNTFSRRERLDSLRTIHSDQDFKDYLAERRKGTPVKEYRSKVLNTLKNREKVLSEIRRLKTRKTKRSPQLSKQEDTIQASYTKDHSKKRIRPTLISILPSTSSKKTTAKNKSFTKPNKTSRSIFKKLFSSLFDSK